MRLVYFLAVIVAATLHASGATLATTKDSNHGVIANVASADIVHALDTTQERGGRMLRDATAKNEVEEERALFDILKYLKTSVGKRLPWTHSHKIYKRFKDAEKARKQLARQQSNMRYAMGHTGDRSTVLHVDTRDPRQDGTHMRQGDATGRWITKPKLCPTEIILV
ncbi:hypothetical protein ON010_g18056 [Phytophthora cinnamomi]|nr:hypothetical protein ON010_g18056 [Phytophthora cinnamomi]